MNYKKIVVLSAVIVLLVICTACQSTSHTVMSAGEEIISLMADMAKCEDYGSLFNLPAAYGEIAKQLTGGDYSHPSKTYMLTFSEHQLLGVSIDDGKYAEPLADYLRSSAYIALASTINRHSGLEALSVSSAYAAQMTFVCPSVKQNIAYLYTFDNGAPIVVFFLPGEDGSVRAIGYFLLNEMLKTDSAEQIETSMSEIGISGVTVTEE